MCPQLVAGVILNPSRCTRVQREICQAELRSIPRSGNRSVLAAHWVVSVIGVDQEYSEVREKCRRGQCMEIGKTLKPVFEAM